MKLLGLYYVIMTYHSEQDGHTVQWRMSKPRAKSASQGKALARPASGSISTLVNQNVRIGHRRTSLRLEPAMWDALDEVCQREGMTSHGLCTMIDRRKRASTTTAAVRVFVMGYFRAAATEDGHACMGHGSLLKADISR